MGRKLTGGKSKKQRRQTRPQRVNDCKKSEANRAHSASCASQRRNTALKVPIHMDTTHDLPCRDLTVEKSAIEQMKPVDLLSPRGLVNLGNTCFFNSAMQNVARISSFKRYFVDNTIDLSLLPAADTASSEVESQRERVDDGVVSDSGDCDEDTNEAALSHILRSEGPMTRALRDFLHKMWATDNSGPINPKYLFSEVGRRNSRFKGRSQQDAHEVLRCLFDAIAEEDAARMKSTIHQPFANNATSTSHARTCSDDENVQPSERNDCASDVPACESALEDERLSGLVGSSRSVNSMTPCKYPFSIIASTLGGKLVSTVRCLECGRCSSVVEPFLDLSVPLVPREKPEQKSDILEDAREPASSLSSVTSITGNDSPDVVPQSHAQNEALLASEENGSINPSKAEAVFDGQRVSFECKSIPPPPPPPPPGRFPRRNVVHGLSKTTNSACSSDVNRRVYIDLHSELEEQIKPLANTAEVYEGIDHVSDLQLSQSPPSPDGSLDAICSDDPRTPVDHSDFSDSDEPRMVDENTVILLGDVASQLSNHQLPTEQYEVENENVDEEDDEPFAAFSLFDDIENDDQIADDGHIFYGPCKAPKGYTEPKRSEDQTARGSSQDPMPGSRPKSFRDSSTCLSGYFGDFEYGAPAAPYGYCSVTESLKSFSQIEILEGDNSYGCEECTRREALRLAREQVSRHGQEDSTGDSGLSKPDGFDGCSVASNGTRGANDKPFLVDDVDLSSVKSHADDFDASDEVVANIESDNMPDEISSRNGDDIIVSSPVTSSESSCGARSEVDSCSGGRSDGDSDKEDGDILRVTDLKIPTVHSRAEKRLMIKDAPVTLIVHLKRFTQSGFRGGLRKLSGHVEFPLELDLSEFVATPKSQVCAANCGNAFSNEDLGEGTKCVSSILNAGNSSVANHLYQLTGVCVHGGSLHGGHYTAFVREGINKNSRGNWFHCSDSHVAYASEREVLGSEAFLLFYERI